MKIDLTDKDLLLFQHIARDLYQNTPANVTLPLIKRPLSHQDFNSLCHLRAAMHVLAAKGVIDVVEFPTNETELK